MTTTRPRAASEYPLGVKIGVGATRRTKGKQVSDVVKDMAIYLGDMND